MANKVGHISGLIHRVASSCLTHHLPHHVDAESFSSSSSSELEQEMRSGGGEDQETEELVEQVAEEEESSEGINSIWGGEGLVLERLKEMESLMFQVFGTVSAVKKAYVSLQEAHCPWDPEKMRVSDAAVVVELRRLGRFRDQFRRAGMGLGGGSAAAAPLREVVAPYEAALEDLRRELRAREVEVESLKEKLVRATTTTTLRGSGITGRKGRIHYGKRVGCISGLGECE